LPFRRLFEKEMVYRGGPQMVMKQDAYVFPRWIPNATSTHQEYVLLISCPTQKWLHELSSILRYTHVVCLALPHTTGV
jgi:hypothetical protein